MSFRERLDKIMAEMGYSAYIDGKSDEEVIQIVEDRILPLSEIDITIPFEIALDEMRDIFYQKYCLPIEMIVAVKHLKSLYHLMVDYKSTH